MSRNNEDRLGLKAKDTGSPAIAQQGTDFSFATPTEFAALPSKGRYYPEDHPCHNKEEVEIRYMTAKDEDILTSAALIKNGTAIDRFLQNVILDKSIVLESLLVGDKNALMVAARITGYGEDYDVNITCPNCYTPQETRFRLDELDVYGGQGYEDAGITASDKGTFFMDMPASKVKVEVKLMTGKDENYLHNLALTKKKKKLPESGLTDQFTRMIVSVNGNEKSSMIRSYVDNMPAKDSKFLRTNYFKVVPNVDMRQDFKCQSCGFDQELEVPFSANFFWPK